MTKYNKSILAAAILIVSNGLAFANGGTYVSSSEVTNPCDFYIGGGISYDMGHFKFSRNLSGNANVSEIFINPFDPNDTETTTLPFANNANYSSEEEGHGMNGELFAGVGWHIHNHYYLGAELFGSLSSLKASKDWDGSFNLYDNENDPLFKGSNQFTNHTSIKLRHSYGISLIPGVMVTHSTMLYGRVGWVRSQFKVNDDFNFSNNPFLTGINSSSTQSKNGLQLGLGVQTMLTSNISASVEYDWAHYGSIHSVGSTSGGVATLEETLPYPQDVPIIVNAKVTRSLSIDPTVNTVKLRLAYHFMSV